MIVTTEVEKQIIDIFQNEMKHIAEYFLDSSSKKVGTFLGIFGTPPRCS